MKQRLALSRPFPERVVKKKPGRGGHDYVPHAIVNERLLHALGPFDFGVVEVVRGYAPEVTTGSGKNEKTHPAREGAIVGVIARLACSVDGRHTVIEEVGSEDAPATHNDAENLKNATSDALKRCAMRLGLGLHLWSGDDYRLDALLERDARGSTQARTSTEAPREPEGGPAPQEATPEAETEPEASSQPPFTATDEQPTPPQPAKESRQRPPRTLDVEEASRLMKALRDLGIPGNQQLDFARETTGRASIEAYTDLTTDEARRLHARANGEPEDDEAEAREAAEKEEAKEATTA